MTTTTPELIALDEDGTAVIAGTWMTVEQIAEIKWRTDMTSEQIQAGFPYLTPAQVSAALAYYEAHQPEMDARFEQQRREREAALETLVAQQQKPTPPGENWLSLIFGKWPGDETDEEINAALERLS